MGTALGLAPSTLLPGALQPGSSSRGRGAIDVPAASASEVFSWLEFRAGRRNLHLGQGEPVWVEVPGPPGGVGHTEPPAGVAVEESGHTPADHMELCPLPEVPFNPR